MIKVENVKMLARAGDYYLSKHADIERQNDGLSLAEIEEVLNPFERG